MYAIKIQKKQSDSTARLYKKIVELRLTIDIKH